jgi:hypothetical protein
MTLRTFSYGGGVQSTAALVLAAEGRIDFPVFIFANTGDDSEHPATLDYIRDFAVPYAAAHGIELVAVQKRLRDGTIDTLHGRLTHPEKLHEGIPVYLPSGAPGMRSCTSSFKVRVIAKELRRRGATRKAPAIVGLGISLDEIHRAKTTNGMPDQVLSYPLIDLRLTRQDCVRVIERSGLPTPQKSACYFCPFHSKAAWHRLLKETPELFERAVALEQTLNQRRAAKGKGQVYLTRDLIPLDQVIVNTGQMEMDFTGLDVCESGYCEVF